ncbi:MAG: hypothetical protein U0Y10_17640 [Spirosomataceae bacterium]
MILAIQLQRNQILQAGLVVDNDGRCATGLEAIAIGLGVNI